MMSRFWLNRRVFLTGHTGFKGGWLGLWLSRLGATVTGFALPPETEPSLCSLIGTSHLSSHLGDIRDPAALTAAMSKANPEIIIHAAAQPLVRRAFREPVETFATNIMGTANVLEAARAQPDLKAILVVTSDKVYDNTGDGSAFSESSRLGGRDPYSASKAAAELAAATWGASYLDAEGVRIATVRAGNVIGGGDFAEDRLVPDVWRAVRSAKRVVLRYPNATRPWQHVLDPLAGYLSYIARLAGDDRELPRALNFGPADAERLTVSELAGRMAQALGATTEWCAETTGQPPESAALRLDSSLAAAVLGWHSRLNIDESLSWTAEWYRAFDRGEDMRALTLDQIARYRAFGAED